MKALVFLFVLPCLVLAQSAAPPKPAVVEGKVVNSVTGEMLRKVDVTLTTSLMPDGFDEIAKQFGLNDDAATPGAPKAPEKPPAPKKSFTATTDGAGKFRFDKIEPGDYYLSAKHVGFGDVNFKPPSKMASEGRLHLTDGREVTDLEIRMVPNGAAAGKVVDEDGDPVPEAVVTAMSYSYMMGHRKLQPADTSPVNDRGEFRLGKLPPGHYYLSASMQANPMAAAPEPPKDGSRETGYVPTYFPRTTDVTQAELIDVKAGADIPGLVIHLQKSLVVRVKGKALTAEGQPIKNGMIMIMGGAGGFSSMRMTTFNDPEGKFEIVNLPPGAYNATIVQMGGTQSAMSMQQLLVPDHNLENVRLGVPAQGVIKGRIVIGDDGKAPLKGVSVSLEADEDMPTMPARGRADDAGAFTVEKVAPGKYTVSLSPTPAGSYTKSLLWNGKDVLGTGLDLTAGMAGDLQVVLGTDGGKVEVDVLQGDQAVADASVVLLPADADRRFSETTFEEDSDDRGHAAFFNVPPGKYVVLAWTDVKEGAWLDPAFVHPFEGQAARLTLGAKGAEKLQVKIAVEAK